MGGNKIDWYDGPIMAFYIEQPITLTLPGGMIFENIEYV